MAWRDTSQDELLLASQQLLRALMIKAHNLRVRAPSSLDGDLARVKDDSLVRLALDSRLHSSLLLLPKRVKATFFSLFRNEAYANRFQNAGLCSGTTPRFPFHGDFRKQAHPS